jgi:hypothetical protein
VGTSSTFNPSFLFFMVLRIQPKPSSMLLRHSTTQPHPQPYVLIAFCKCLVYLWLSHFCKCNLLGMSLIYLMYSGSFFLACSKLWSLICISIFWVRFFFYSCLVFIFYKCSDVETNHVFWGSSNM